jgi:hypothetical protein
VLLVAARAVDEMRGPLEFVTLARRYGKADWVTPLEVFGRIATWRKTLPSTFFYSAITDHGHQVAHSCWKFLRGLPQALGASPEEFVLGAKPVGSLDDQAASAASKWDGWLQHFYAMALSQAPPRAGDALYEYRDDLLHLVYDEMDPWLPTVCVSGWKSPEPRTRPSGAKGQSL